MESAEYENVLLGIAKEVYERVFCAGDDSLLQRLRNALKDLAAQEEKHRGYQKGLKEICSYKPTPKEYEDFVLRLFKCPVELSKAEAERRNLIMLSCIYDKKRLIVGATQDEKINDSVLSDDYEAIWQYLSGERHYYEGKVQFVESALRSIQPKAEAPKTEPEKGNKMNWADSDPDYMLISDANVKLADNKLAAKDNKIIKQPDSGVRYMSKGRRLKVHIGDFRQYIQKKYPVNVGELADKEIDRREKVKTKTAYENLARKISSPK